VKSEPQGRVFEGEDVFVAGAEPGREARLQVGDATMCAELQGIAAERQDKDEGFPFRLISRRLHHVMNTTGRNNPRQMRKQRYNPAYMNPGDLAALGLKNGDEVRIASRYGEIPGIVEAEEGIRSGVISMSHCFGPDPENPGPVREFGSNVALLSSVEHEVDPYSGIPRMSAIPVRVLTV
jgi:anaerobic selenocysteine-containing dehydrogenase